jgi:hypothetical protein
MAGGTTETGASCAHRLEANESFPPRRLFLLFVDLTTSPPTLPSLRAAAAFGFTRSVPFGICCAAAISRPANDTHKKRQQHASMLGCEVARLSLSTRHRTHADRRASHTVQYPVVARPSLMSSSSLPSRRPCASPAPHKDFSDLYEKMSGKGASASEAHPPRAARLRRPSSLDEPTRGDGSAKPAAQTGPAAPSPTPEAQPRRSQPRRSPTR